jgi:phage/plasmid-like protein (TIGR03299 family)
MVANVQTMMYYKAGGVPWHGLGKALDNPPTSREAIVQAGLDWEVERIPLMVAAGPTAGQNVPDAFGIIRKDNGVYLSTVGSKFQPVQNKDGFESCDYIIGGGRARYETAGALGRGERVWILAQLPGDISVKGKDAVKKYLLFANGHDGRHALQMLLTPVRVVCQNTLNMALSHQDSKEFLHISHVGDMKIKMEQAKLAFEAIVKRYDMIAKLFESLAGKVLNGEDRQNIVYQFIPKKADDEKKAVERKAVERGRIVNLMENGKGNDVAGIRGTAWAAYNGLTEYVDHWQNGFEDNASVSLDKVNARWNRIAFGVGAKRKVEALDIVREVAGV